MYYAQEDDKIIGAPSIAGVLSQLKKRPDFNRAYIERYLSSGIYFYAPNDMATLFEGIYREPYGCKLQLKDNQFYLERDGEWRTI